MRRRLEDKPAQIRVGRTFWQQQMLMHLQGRGYSQPRATCRKGAHIPGLSRVGENEVIKKTSNDKHGKLRNRLVNELCEL